MTINFGDPGVRDAVPIVFAAKVLSVIENKLVFGKIADKAYQGEITEAGCRVVIRGLGEVEIKEYDATAAHPVTYEKTKDVAMFLDIDKAYYYGIQLGDLKKKQSDINIMSNYAGKAGYGLDKKVDLFIASLYSQCSGGTPYVSDQTCDTSTVTSTLGELWDACEGVNIDKKFLVLPSWVVLKLQLAGIIQAQDLKGDLKNGFIGRVLNFDMYQSNNCALLNSEVKRNAIMAGSYDAIAFAQQIIDTEVLRLQDDFADAVRGFHVWGSKVLKPKELFYADLKWVTEANI